MTGTNCRDMPGQNAGTNGTNGTEPQVRDRDNRDNTLKGVPMSRFQAGHFRVEA